MRFPIVPGIGYTPRHVDEWGTFEQFDEMLIQNAVSNAVLVQPSCYGVDNSAMLDAIARHKPTFFPGVPTLYVSLLNHPKAAEMDFSSIKYFNSGSAPLPLDVTQRFEELTGCILRQGYGLSETSPTTHSTSQLGLRKPESCGIPFPDTECKIVDLETGETEVPLGEMGELCVRGPQVMRGYWNRPEETAKVMLAGGWLRTGDVGRMDERGRTFIEDRKKDMILVSGFNVYPNEVEGVVAQMPAVLEVAAVAQPDDKSGEVVALFIVRKDPALTAEEVVAYCKRELAPYKVPRQFEMRDNLPMSAVGKILYRVLRD